LIPWKPLKAMSREKLPDTQTISIPWGAWDGDVTFDLSFPSDWEIDLHAIEDSPRLDDRNIQSALKLPVGTPDLGEMARGKNKVVIAVEDITRPVRFERVLEYLMSALLKAGVRKEQILFVMCNGAHAPMLKADLRKKLGQRILDEYLILNHNPYDNLSDTGIVLGKTPVRINRAFMEADLRIVLGSIIPHSFAGFSAGAKLILPGLADIATLERSHKYVMMGFRGGVNDVEVNKFREEIEDVAGQIGVDFFVGVVPDSKREIAGVFAGDVVEAHRAGVNFGRRIYRTEIRPPYDVAVFNAYPKDGELLQADTALTALKTLKEEVLTPDGVIVIISRCSNGLGYHGLFGPGMRLSRKPIKRRYLNGRDLIVVAPGINHVEFNTLYWDGYTLANEWDAVISHLKKRYHDKCRVAVFPTAPLQLLKAIDNTES